MTITMHGEDACMHLYTSGVKGLHRKSYKIDEPEIELKMILIFSVTPLIHINLAYFFSDKKIFLSLSMSS